MSGFVPGPHVEARDRYGVYAKVKMYGRRGMSKANCCPSSDHASTPPVTPLNHRFDDVVVVTYFKSRRKCQSNSCLELVTGMFRPRLEAQLRLAIKGKARMSHGGLFRPIKVRWSLNLNLKYLGAALLAGEALPTEQPRLHQFWSKDLGEAHWCHHY